MTALSPPTLTTERRRWLALLVVCLAQLMIVLDTTIVNVALPSIQHDLHFTQGDLTWVINAFLVTFGSFLLLAGRLGDLVGRKRVFLTGVTIFTAASIACGLAPDSGFLIVARFVQGFGAALQASVILAIIVTEFPDEGDRARAMSAYVFVSVAGGSLGLLAGGVLTSVLSWHWIFFVNVPIGAATIALGQWLVPADRGQGLDRTVDWLGSVLVTAAVAIGVDAIVQVTSHGWDSAQVLGTGAASLVLLVLFGWREATARNPIMPPRILRVRSLMVGSAVRGLLVTGMYSTFFLGTLYLEHIRGYTALQTGLAFLPWTLTVAALSLGVTRRVVALIGPLRTVMAGIAVVVAGLVLLQATGLHTAFFPTVFLAYMLIGFGIGSAFTPLLTVAMREVPMADAGLASGITNVAMQVAGAISLAALGTVATDHSRHLIATGHATASSLVAGYHLAYLAGASTVLAGLVLAATVLRRVVAASTAANPLLRDGIRDEEPSIDEPSIDEPVVDEFGVDLDVEYA